jgi:hypothetical protein
MSCSKFVMSKLKDEGVISGLRAFLFRFNNCRAGYQIIEKENEIYLLTVKGSLIKKDDVNCSIIEQYCEIKRFQSFSNLVSKSSKSNN